MFTHSFKIKNKQINLSWTDSKNFKDLLGSHTNWFGNRSDFIDFTDKIIANGLLKEYEVPLNYLLDNITLSDNPSIVDIGSGTSIIDLVLYQFLDKKAKFYLIDSDTVSHTNKGILHSKEFAPFNSWEPTIDAIETNNFNRDDFTFWLPNTSDSEKAKTQYENVQVDLVLSRSSCGLHYPIDVYWEHILKILKPGGWLYISPMLNVGNQYELVCSYFGEPKAKRVTYVKEINKFRPNEVAYWESVILNAKEENAIWAYKAIWQRPF